MRKKESVIKNHNVSSANDDLENVIRVVYLNEISTQDRSRYLINRLNIHLLQ